jgi:hypothetical protein
VEPSPLLLRPLLAYCTSSRWWWMMMSVEQSVDCVEGETKVLVENLSQYRFVHHKSHMTWPGLQLGRQNGKPGTNRLDCGTALAQMVSQWILTMVAWVQSKCH